MPTHAISESCFIFFFVLWVRGVWLNLGLWCIQLTFYLHLIIKSQGVNISLNICQKYIITIIVACYHLECLSKENSVIRSSTQSVACAKWVPSLVDRNISASVLFLKNKCTKYQFYLRLNLTIIKVKDKNIIYVCMLVSTILTFLSKIWAILQFITHL